MCPAEDCDDVEAGVDVVGGEGSNSEGSGGEVLRARRTAGCFGGWEYQREAELPGLPWPNLLSCE